MSIEATFRSSDPYTVTGERANGAIVWSNGIIWKDGPADGALCGQWTQYHNGQIYTVVQIGSSEIQWVSGANETHFPASITAPPVPPHLQSDIDRVTSTFELVQLAKAAGVATTTINMCFNNEVLHPRHKHIIQTL